MAGYTQLIMLRILAAFILVSCLALVLPAAAESVLDPQSVRALPGGLDDMPMFNSNSPEVVGEEGILLSTFSAEGKRVPEAHLNCPLSGNFEIFSHHVNNRVFAGDEKTLHIALLVFNPGREKTVVTISAAASYLSQPDAPFVALPSCVENPRNLIFAGPGDRVMGDILQGKHQKGWPARFVLKPGEGRVLADNPIPVQGLIPPINGRSTLVEAHSDHPVFVAELAAFARDGDDGKEHGLAEQEWWRMLSDSGLAGPRDKQPTAPGTTTHVVFGRVAGVARGARWTGRLADGASDAALLSVPDPGNAISYPICTVDQGTLGTGQVQSAPLMVRYPDSAYQAHGNYAVRYDLTIPVYNSGDRSRTVSIALQSPIKTNEPPGGLKFHDPPPARVFFRGTVRVKQGIPPSRDRYFHLVLNQGERGVPLLTLTLAAHNQQTVHVQFLYPPDCTPPQALTIKTTDEK